MAMLKCKMCGGDLEIILGETTCECEYCGSKQTVPQLDDEKKINLFTRANRLRSACEFDKAAGVYESIISEFQEEPEAYWGLLLCRYGIEYVDDPKTGKKIPTCHRSSFNSIFEDKDFEMVMECSDVTARGVYREEAKAIETLRTAIIEVSSKEEPYDIFICYKETDANGDRTVDSVLAQEVYDALTEKGYRVFFSRITLEDKLGQEYEPYIFAALNSAKVMLAFGTDYEYYNAVWVKNEWSRFLSLIEKGEKKYLIPCFKDIDAYDMPGEFKRLQAQDMGKIGAIQDLIRGIEKLIGKRVDNSSVIVGGQAIATEEASRGEAALKRGWMAIDDEDWDKADTFFEDALSYNAECSSAYLGKVYVAFRVKNLTDLEMQSGGSIDSKDYEKFKRFASEDEKINIIRVIDEHREQEELKRKKEAEEIQRQRDIEQEKKEEEEKRLEEEQRIRCEEEQRIRESVLGTSISDIRNNLNFMKGIIKAEGRFSFGFSEGENLTFTNLSARWTDVIKTSVGLYHVVGIKSDGTVVAYGENLLGECSVSGWKEVIDIKAGQNCTIALKTDGTVDCTGRSSDEIESKREKWISILELEIAGAHVIGLKADGSIVITGEDYKGWNSASTWTDVISISVGSRLALGLKHDGSVLSVGMNDENQIAVRRWSNIVNIACGFGHAVGLRDDGSVVAAGENTEGQCNVDGWTDIVCIAVGGDFTIGLKSDGTVVATGCNAEGQCNVWGWSNIIFIVAGSAHTLGLKSDGSVIATGRNMEGQCNVDDWKLFNKLDSLIKNKKEMLANKVFKLGEIKQNLLNDITEDEANRKIIYEKKEQMERELNGLSIIQIKRKSELQGSISNIAEQIANAEYQLSTKKNEVAMIEKQIYRLKGNVAMGV